MKLVTGIVLSLAALPRVLRVAGKEVFYIETVNSRYRLEIRGREVTLDGAVGGGT